MIGALAGLGPSYLSRPVGSGFAAETAPAAGGPPAPAGSFAAALANLAGETVGTLKGAESASLAGLSGKADTREVVEAVMGAEQALQTAVSIRDKIVSAYLEVSRMAI